MDKLQECAKKYENLINTKYRYIIGRKGETATILLTFEPVNFHHLMGLHKLIDLRISRGNREKVFEEILAGDISLASVEKSLYYGKIAKRIDLFANLEQILDDNNLVFRYNKKENSFSLIQAEYLLSTPYEAYEVYIFLDRKKPDEQYFCRSFFPKENKDYTIGQPVYTLLYKEKITISTGEKEVQYDRLSPTHKN
jgi:hypothetical protein